MSMNKKGMRFPIYPTGFGSFGMQKISQIGRVCLALPLVPLVRAAGLLCRTSCDSKESIPYILSYTSSPDLGSTWLTSTEAFDMQFWLQVMTCLVFWLCHKYGATAAKLTWRDSQASARTADGFGCPRHREVWWHQRERERARWPRVVQCYTGPVDTQQLLVGKIHMLIAWLGVEVIWTHAIVKKLRMVTIVTISKKSWL